MHRVVEIAEAVRTVSRAVAAPLAMAAYFGVEVYAVPRDRLLFRFGQYMRVGRTAVIHVDAVLRGVARDAVVAHELAHHLLWWWRIDAVRDEEAWCDAVARELLRDPLAAVRPEQAHAMQIEQAREVQRPLNDSFVWPTVRAA